MRGRDRSGPEQRGGGHEDVHHLLSRGPSAGRKGTGATDRARHRHVSGDRVHISSGVREEGRVPSGGRAAKGKYITEGAGPEQGRVGHEEVHHGRRTTFQGAWRAPRRHPAGATGQPTGPREAAHRAASAP